MSAQDAPKSYDYARRKGVRQVSWEEFSGLCETLAETLARKKIDTIIGVARAGLFPATLVASMLRCELYPVRLTRRLHDEVIYDSPVWRVPVSHLVQDRAVAIVDEIADTGESLAMVAQEVRALKASRAVTAVLISHSWAKPEPDVSALVSDELIVFPWDQKVLVNDEWVDHPEIAAALKAQDAGHD